jgi:hypothetical protein
VLIGMDVLARSREMAIDYEKGVVHFRSKPSGAYPVGLQTPEGTTALSAPSSSGSPTSAIPPSLTRP